MTTAEPAWKKFLKLKKEIPTQEANLADSTNTLKRKREVPATVKDASENSTRRKPPPKERIPQKTKENRRKKQSKLKGKRNRQVEVDSKAAKQAALEYLSLYTSARSAWKFSKPRQNYLVKHVYDEDVISEETFPKLVEYLDGLQGGARQRCVELAKDLVLRYDKQVQATLDTTDDKRDEDTEELTADQKKRAEIVRDSLSVAHSEKNGITNPTEPESDVESVVSSGSPSSISSTSLESA